MDTIANLKSFGIAQSRYRVLVLGGGVHGLGVLHDLSSRGWKDVLLVEKGELGNGTSSRSTKLIHGGLRYLQRISGFSLVNEALRERQVLMHVAPELTRPMKFCFPVLKSGGYPGFYIRSGLFLYDLLAGRHNIKKHGVFDDETLRKEMPALNHELFSKVYSFWDTQMDDVRLLRKIADSATKLGAQISEHTQAVSMKPTSEGWDVTLRDASGETRTVSALYVVNALGSWANEFLTKCNIEPEYDGVNNKGVHLLVPNIGHEIGAYLQSPKDKRIFFILPWYQYSLLGTTESLYGKRADELTVDENDVDYILERCNQYLKNPIKPSDVELSFAGLRWLAKERGVGISSMSRSHLVSYHDGGGRGRVITLYGGKWTTYRSLSEQIGDYILRDFGEFVKSRTADKDSWVEEASGSRLWENNEEIKARFSAQGVGYTPFET